MRSVLGGDCQSDDWAGEFCPGFIRESPQPKWGTQERATIDGLEWRAQ